MEEEVEITAEVNVGLNDLLKIMKDNGFVLKEEYDLNDIYLIKNDDKSENYLHMLNKCVLIRSIIFPDHEYFLVTYKYKEYTRDNDIKNQTKISCKIENPKEMSLIFERLGFEELIKINDHLLVFYNNTDEIAIQYVNNKHLYIEIEKESETHTYSSLKQMKDFFKKYNIPIKNDNYFAKKAEVELQERYQDEK